MLKHERCCARHRPHSSFTSKMRMERYCDLIQGKPLNEEVGQDCDNDEGLDQERDYKVEMQVRALKQCW